MTCDWSEQVALAVDDGISADLQKHLASCPDCRDLLEELRSDQLLLQQVADVPQGAVAERVLCSLRARRWRMLLPAIAAVLVVAAFVLPHRTTPVSPEVTIVQVGPFPPAPPPVAASPKLAPQPAHRRALAAAVRKPRTATDTHPDKLMASLAAMFEPASTATASTDSPVLITTQTADPDVVIVLVAERKGDEE